MKLKGKLAIAMTIMLIISMSIIGGGAYYVMSNLAITNVENDMSVSANFAATEVSDFLQSYLQEAVVTGQDPIITGEYDDSVKVARVKALAEEYGFTSGNILNASCVSLDDGTDYSDRDYAKKALAGQANISEVTLSKLTGKYGVSLAAPRYDAYGNINGVVYFRMDIDFMLNIVNSIVFSENSYAYILDSAGNIIVHPNQDLILAEDRSLLDSADENLKAMATMATSGEEGTYEYTYEGEDLLCAFSPITDVNGWSLIVVAPRNDFSSNISDGFRFIAIYEAIILILGIIAAIGIANAFAKSIKTVNTAIAELEAGDFSHEVPDTNGKDEFAYLQRSIRSMQQNMKKLIDQTNYTLSNMSQYNLAVPDMDHYEGDYDVIATSVNDIKAILNKLIREVQSSASGVNVGSGEIANATDLLSRGTVTQASSIQIAVDDVNNISDTINDSLSSAMVIDEKLKELDRMIQKGNTDMTELKKVVGLVAEMSADIQKIVGTIDSIAFQTNILSLNASVEAARAGENGKGFAVVADEIGALAMKSSDASKQTAELIGRCLDGINSALEYAETTSDSFGEIVKNSAEISDAFDEITENNREQADKAGNIKKEIGSISDVVQTNTATAEETAAATQELSEQARTLGELVSRFRV